MEETPDAADGLDFSETRLDRLASPAVDRPAGLALHSLAQAFAAGFVLIPLDRATAATARRAGTPW